MKYRKLLTFPYRKIFDKKDYCKIYEKRTDSNGIFELIVSAQMNNGIQEGIQDFHDMTCLQFVPNSQRPSLPHNTHIAFVNGFTSLTFLKTFLTFNFDVLPFHSVHVK